MRSVIHSAPLDECCTNSDKVRVERLRRRGDALFANRNQTNSFDGGDRNWVCDFSNEAVGFNISKSEHEPIVATLDDACCVD